MPGSSVRLEEKDYVNLYEQYVGETALSPVIMLMIS